MGKGVRVGKGGGRVGAGQMGRKGHGWEKGEEGSKVGKGGGRVEGEKRGRKGRRWKKGEVGVPKTQHRKLIR